MILESYFKNTQAAKTEVKNNYLFLCQKSLVRFNTLNIMVQVDNFLASSSEPRDLVFPKEMREKPVKFGLQM